MIHELGDAPYPILRPLLFAMDPEQLYEHEQTSPQIIGADQEIWKMFIRRDIENCEQELDLHTPQDPRDWYDTYQTLLERQKYRMARDEENLKNTLDGIKNFKAQHTSRKVELDIVKPPTGVNASKEVIKVTGSTKRYLKDDRGTRDFDNGVVKWEREHGSLGEQSRYRNLKAKVVPKVTAKPKSKLDQLRRETKAISQLHRPTKKAMVPVGKVTEAPRHLIEQYRKPLSAKPIHPTMPKPKESNPLKRRIEHVMPEESCQTLEQRERRLKAAKLSSTAPASQLSYSEREEPATQKHKPRSPTASPSSKSISATSGSASPRSSVTSSSPLPPASNSRSPSPFQVQRAMTASPAAGVKPVIRMKKQPVSIFMPKKQRVN